MKFVLNRELSEAMAPDEAQLVRIGLAWWAGVNWARSKPLGAAVLQEALDQYTRDNRQAALEMVISLDDDPDPQRQVALDELTAPLWTFAGDEHLDVLVAALAGEVVTPAQVGAAVHTTVTGAWVGAEKDVAQVLVSPSHAGPRALVRRATETIARGTDAEAIRARDALELVDASDAQVAAMSPQELGDRLMAVARDYRPLVLLEAQDPERVRAHGRGRADALVAACSLLAARTEDDDA